MSDIADDSDDRIEMQRQHGIERARAALKNNRLRPIVREDEDGANRVGVCHYCESEIPVGHLFCRVDTETPEQSCSIEWEHERKRMEDLGQ